MILAGVDEAGYGPLLGPLVVGCCAFDVQGEIPAEALPCLWKRLRRACGKKRDKKNIRLHINDSKIVYSPALGLKELEKSVLALCATLFGWSDALPEFLGKVCPHVLPELNEYPWYAPSAEERFPMDVDPALVRMAANLLQAEMDRTATRLVHYAVQVLPERRLNRLFDTTRNKSSVLFSIAAIHLDHLLRNFGQQNLTIFCDRQGGREHYGHLLRLMLEEWSLQVIEEVDDHSEYRLLRGGHAVRLLFREKAEVQCLPVAAASMLCKYTREALMCRFNAYWKALLPELEPTAGYYNDALRFLRDIESMRRELGIGDAQLIRAR